MAYSGWLAYAGTEIANEARTRAYVSELVPGLAMPTDCRDDVDLAAVLQDKPYSTPAIDDAPWFDADDWDTAGFCGFFPLSVSGLTDSNRTANVIESSTDGGSITGMRRKTREVRVSGLLIGTTDAAVEAGKRWLSAALDGSCQDPCDPAELCFLTAVPDLSVALGDWTQERIVPSRMTGPSGRWNITTGLFSPTTSAQAVSTPLAPQPMPCDEIKWSWTVRGQIGTQIALETLGEDGVTNSETFTLSGSDQLLTVSDRGLSERKSWSRLRVLTASRTVTVTDAIMEYRLPADPDVCFNKYLRQLRGVQAIDGPTTTQEFSPTEGAMQKVEFSMVAGVPHIYGVEQEIIEQNGKQIQAKKPGSEVIRMAKTVAACPGTRLPSLIMDPDCPPIPVPPRSAIPASSCAPEPTSYESYAAYIPDGIVPLWNDAVPILSLKTGKTPAKLVKVRFMPRPLTNQQPEDLDPCSACGQFVIDYIPPWSTFILNGMEERAYIKRGTVTSPADHLLSGYAPAELFEWPLLSCGTGYYAIIDAATYALAGISINLAVRE